MRRQIRFVLVNGRTPCRQSFCVRCCEPIGASYLREIGTRLCYCDPKCYAGHGKTPVLALEIHAAASALATELLVDSARMFGFDFRQTQP
jgi:hypothetical protein